MHDNNTPIYGHVRIDPGNIFPQWTFLLDLNCLSYMLHGVSYLQADIVMFMGQGVRKPRDANLYPLSPL